MLFFVGDKRATTKIVTPGVRGFAEGPTGWTSAVLAVRLSGKGQIRFTVGIDRSVLSTSAFVADLVRDLPHDGDNWLCVSAIYPRPDNLYRNAFVHSRIRTYRKAGRNVPVVSLEGNDPIPGSYMFDGALVLVGGKRILREVVAARRFSRILVHNMSRDLMDVLNDTAPDVKKIVWIHAFETESWFRRWCNFELAAPDVSQRILASKTLCDSRTEVLGEVYRRSRADGDCRSIFVSDWFYRNVAIIDTRQTPQDYRIIPNPIDTALFRPRAKQPEDRFKWLSIRPYTARNYANDLTVAAILLLSEESWFPKAQITLVGRGPLFDSTVAPLRKFSNVKLENTFLRQAEIPGYHARHGLFLCPSRHDSQGVSLGEAMASGLVPISNDRMAIPDFVPREWGVLARHDDPVDLAARIKLLVENPDRFMDRAAKASSHIQSLCGDEKSLQAELKAISDT